MVVCWKRVDGGKIVEPTIVDRLLSVCTTKLSDGKPFLLFEIVRRILSNKNADEFGNDCATEMLTRPPQHKHTNTQVS